MIILDNTGLGSGLAQWYEMNQILQHTSYEFLSLRGGDRPQKFKVIYMTLPKNSTDSLQNSMGETSVRR